MPTDNRAALMRLYDVLNSGDLDLLDSTVDAVVDPDVALHTPLPTDSAGAEGMKQGLTMLRRAFPDLTLDVQDVIAEGDRVVVRNRVTGTHEGAHMGLAPTGRSFAIDEIMITRFDAGRIVEVWGVVDALSQLQQLGALPAAPEGQGPA